jgi:hypothetical protein
MDTLVFSGISPRQKFFSTQELRNPAFSWLSGKKNAKFCCLSALFNMWLGFWKEGEFYLLKITRFSLIVPDSSSEKNGNIYHIFLPNQN